MRMGLISGLTIQDPSLDETMLSEFCLPRRRWEKMFSVTYQTKRREEKSQYIGAPVFMC
jgi:hypothetical protein